MLARVCWYLDPSRDPRINERDEAEVRQELQTASGLPHAQACAKVLELEGAHAIRRDWVWARTDMSPWALALRPMARLAQFARKTVGGATDLHVVAERFTQIRLTFATSRSSAPLRVWFKAQ
jgi:hypothetical protein